MKYRFIAICAVVLLLPNTFVLAESYFMGCSFEDDSAKVTSIPWFEAHFQLTSVTQAHPNFSAPYSGKNSLSTDGESAMSLTATLFAKFQLWKGAEFVLHPELAGGEGLSGATGVAGFPNGETFRVGQAKPVLYIARAYLRQRFDFSDEPDTTTSVLAKSVQRPSELFSRSGSTSRLTLVAGKFSAADFFDESSYSHDPRTQFLNWSLMSAGAWDYPADTRGYTWGVAAEYTLNNWSFNAMMCLVPMTANGLEMDTRISEAHGIALQVEYNYAILGRKGVARLLGFRNIANAGNYERAVTLVPRNPDISDTRHYGASKVGFILGLEQELSEHSGLFARASWNDGANETWAFTEIDQSLCIGVQLAGQAWKRDTDILGVATVVNGISENHRRYLAAGGYGFIIGDGALSYAPEWITEIYYRFQVTDWLQLSADYQLVLNPAYNQVRGPLVHIGAFRAHVEF